jgi:hypothetical protein
MSCWFPQRRMPRLQGLVDVLRPCHWSRSPHRRVRCKLRPGCNAICSLPHRIPRRSQAQEGHGFCPVPYSASLDCRSESNPLEWNPALVRHRIGSQKISIRTRRSPVLQIIFFAEGVGKREPKLKARCDGDYQLPSLFYMRFLYEKRMKKQSFWPSGTSREPTKPCQVQWEGRIKKTRKQCGMISIGKKISTLGGEIR